MVTTTPTARTLVAIAKRAEDQSTPHHSGAAARTATNTGYVGVRSAAPAARHVTVGVSPNQPPHPTLSSRP